MTKGILLLLLFAGSLMLHEQGQTHHGLAAHVAVIENDGTVTVRAIFSNQSRIQVSYNYSLVSRRTGPSGNSTTNQSGHFTAEAGRQIVLSTVKINIQQDDRYWILLHILDDDSAIVAQDSLEYNGLG